MSEISNRNSNESQIDLINRRDAIEYIESEYRQWDDEYGVTDVLKDLEDMPSAQPNLQPTCNLVTDCISRQAAVDICNYAIDLWHGQLGEGIVIAVRKRIEELPSAKPDTKAQLSREDTTFDLISRQDAIDAVGNMLRRKFGIGGDLAEITLAGSPSAQPERLTDDDFETIRIHLNAYKEKLCNQQRWEEAEEYQRIIDRFMSFASVQPDLSGYSDRLWKAAYERGKAEAQRTGKWQITDAYPHNVYCSECHKKFAQTHWAVWEDGSLPRNYCPNCGAKMEIPEDIPNRIRGMNEK